MTAALLTAALITDAKAISFYLVLSAIPACAAAALAHYGRLVDGSADADTGALHVGLAALALLLCVVAAVARTNGGETLGVTAVIGALVLLGVHGSVWCSRNVNRTTIVSVLRSIA